jgi:Tfp pilus assembly protein PilF
MRMVRKEALLVVRLRRTATLVARVPGPAWKGTMSSFTSSTARVPRRDRRVRMPVAVAFGLALALPLASCGAGSSASASHPTPSTTAAATAAHLTPTSLLPTLNRALSEQTHKQYAAAVVDFLNVVKADPNSQIAWYDLGVIAQLHAENAQAITDYETAIKGDPSYVPALYNLAVLEAPSQPKSAAALYNDVIRIQPASAAAHLNLGFVLLSIGSRAAAKVELADAIRLDPAFASRVPAADRPG